MHTVYPVLLASADFNDWWVVADRRHAYPQPFWRARTSQAWMQQLLRDPSMFVPCIKVLSHVAPQSPRPAMPTPIPVTRVSHLLQRRMPLAKPLRDSMCWHVWYGALPVSQSWSKWQSCRTSEFGFSFFWGPP